MNTRTLAVMAVSAGIGLVLAACDGGDGGEDAGPQRVPGGAADGADDGAADDGANDGADDGAAADDGADDGGGAGDGAPLSVADVQFYLAKIAPYIAGRSLTHAENQRIEEEGEAAIYPIIESWIAEPGFGEAIRYMIQTELHASGQAGGVDYELPGNLAYEVATQNLPWSTILTADYCVDGDGQHIECDTGAPYAAGVLATRAYMIPNKGRFNLSRAKLMLETFACRIYPMEADIQVPLEKDFLIPMFRADTEADQTVEEAKGGFGNGTGCYACHSQFGAHAQLFVRYDEDGMWRADATGLQDESPEAELGRSFDGLYASHFDAPTDAAAENSWIFGEPVANLREAGEVISDSRLFRECTVKNTIANTFGLLAGASDTVDDALVARLADDVEAVDPDPTISQYVLEVFTDDEVIRAVVATLGGDQ